MSAPVEAAEAGNGRNQLRVVSTSMAMRVDVLIPLSRDVRADSSVRAFQSRARRRAARWSTTSTISANWTSDKHRTVDDQTFRWRPRHGVDV